jgi:hypothetical protein
LQSVGVLLGFVALGCGSSDKGAVDNDEGEGSATFVFEAAAGGAQVDEGSYSWTQVVAFGTRDVNDRLATTHFIGLSDDPCALEFEIDLDGPPPSTLAEFPVSVFADVVVSRGGAIGSPCESESPKRWDAQSGVIAVHVEGGLISAEFSAIPMSPSSSTTQPSNEAVGTFVLSGTAQASDFR